MSEVMIICDDFRIGGIQRIALDQAYKLNEIGVKAKILILGSEPNIDSPSFMVTEKVLIANLGVCIEFLPGNRLFQGLKRIL
jgi:hypothetical protein